MKTRRLCTIHGKCVLAIQTTSSFVTYALKWIVQSPKNLIYFYDFVRVFKSNVTITNLYYFWFAPTLTYQFVFPRLARRDIQQILSLSLRLFLCFVLLGFLVAQFVRPVLNNMLEELNELKEEERHILSIHIFAEYLLKLG